MMLALAALATPALADPVGTAFTYQGRLKSAGAPANGDYAMVFTLWNDPTATAGANQVGSAIEFDGLGGNPAPVSVVDGLFTVTLDFGAVFTGNALWLEVEVAGTPLSPRSELTPAPHAAFSTAPWITAGTNIHYLMGNVGIGTSNPAARLQVDDGAIRVRNNADNKNWDLAYDATSNYFYVDEFGAARRFVIENGGNVGIGTTNPDRHLVVKSPISRNESTWIQIDSGGVSSQYSGLELMDRGAAKWEVGKTPSNEFYVEEPGVARRLTIQPGTGNFQLTNDASISGVDQIIGFNDLRLAADSTGGPDMVIQPSGNVGIGTTTPGNKLTVAGIIETTSGGIRFPDGSVQTTAGGGGGGGGSWASAGSNIHNLNAGNVGIGLSDPASKLEVNGGVRALGGAPDGDPGSVNVGYAFENSPNSGVFAPSAGQVSLFVQGARGMMITPTGFVPDPAVHLGIDSISDALIQTGRLNVRGLFGEFAGTAITASGGDGFPAIRVDTGGDDAVGIYVQGSLGANSVGVLATGDTGISGEGETYGVSGFSGDTGVNGTGAQIGVEGIGLGFGGSIGVRGEAPGVAIHGDGGIGVRATGHLYGIQAELPADPEIAVGHAIIAFVEDEVNDFAATFHGKVHVDGMLSKAGGTFKIDHPLDPENKTLSHSFVESPDMMNIYNGNAVTDRNGEAWVELPAYFDALNRDFRYQLTVVDTEQFAQARVFRKIEGNRFGIKTDRPGVEVSWQVTGVRQDPWAEQNRVQVEELKPEAQRGFYLNARAYGQPDEKALRHYTRSSLDALTNADAADADQARPGVATNAQPQ